MSIEFCTPTAPLPTPVKDHPVKELDWHYIPPIDLIKDPMGKNWEQPDRKTVFIVPPNGTDQNRPMAFVRECDVEKLAEYSCSMPSGCYPGKMWLFCYGAHDAKVPLSEQEWWLRWFVDGGKVNGREVCQTKSARLVLYEE